MVRCTVILDMSFAHCWNREYKMVTPEHEVFITIIKSGLPGFKKYKLTILLPTYNRAIQNSTSVFQRVVIACFTPADSMRTDEFLFTAHFRSL